MTDDIQTVREALTFEALSYGVDVGRISTEAYAALARVEAVVKAARHVVTHGSVGVPALTRALAALDPNRGPGRSESCRGRTLTTT